MYHSNLKKNTTRTRINILLTPQYSSNRRVDPYHRLYIYWTRLTEYGTAIRLWSVDSTDPWPRWDPVLIIIITKDWTSLIRPASRVTTVLANVSSVFQLFSFLVICSGMISKGFGFVTFFARVNASSVCIHLSCLVCL